MQNDEKEEAVINSNKCQKSDYLLLAKTIKTDVSNVQELEKMQVMYPKYNKKYTLEQEMSFVALVYFEPKKHPLKQKFTIFSLLCKST